MYGVFSYIYHKNQPNVGKYTIHGSYGFGWVYHSPRATGPRPTLISFKKAQAVERRLGKATLPPCLGRDRRLMAILSPGIVLGEVNLFHPKEVGGWFAFFFALKL